MKSLDHETRERLRKQSAELLPPITALPVEAKRAARALLRMKPAR